MTEKKTAKKDVKVAPEETVETEAVVTNADAEVTADSEVLNNTGEITEVPDNDEQEEKPKKKLTKREKYISELADEVERGVHGSGRERMITLGADYAEVQAELTRRVRKAQQK